MRKRKKLLWIVLGLILFVIISSWIDVLLLKDFVCQNLKEHSLFYFYISRNVAEVIAAILGFIIGVLVVKIRRKK